MGRGTLEIDQQSEYNSVPADDPSDAAQHQDESCTAAAPVNDDAMMDAQAQQNSNRSFLDRPPRTMPVSRGSFWIGVVSFLAGAAIGMWSGSTGKIIETIGGSTGNIIELIGANPTNTSTAETPPQLIDETYLASPNISALMSSLTDDLISSDRGGPLFVLKQVSDLMEVDNDFLDNCHHFVHRLGRAAYQNFGVDGALAGVLGTDDAELLRICNGAYLHGIIETHLKESDQPVEVAKELNTKVCVPLGNVPKGTWECRHGIGHGLIQHIRNEKDLQTITGAISSCQNKYFDIESTKACENGAWMDFFVSSRFEGGFSFDLSSSSRSFELCANSATLISSDCALYAPTEYLIHRPRDYEGAIQWCLAGDSISSSLQMSCVGGVGMQTAKENLRDYQFVEKICLTAPDQSHQNRCMSMSFLYRSFSTGEAKMPEDICLQLQHFKDDCLNFRN